MTRPGDRADDKKSKHDADHDPGCADCAAMLPLIVVVFVGHCSSPLLKGRTDIVVLMRPRERVTRDRERPSLGPARPQGWRLDNDGCVNSSRELLDEGRAKTVRHCRIGKTPRHIIAVVRATPPSTQLWLYASRTVPRAFRPGAFQSRLPAQSSRPGARRLVQLTWSVSGLCES